MTKSVRVALAAVVSTVVSAVAYYICLPPLNAQSPSFWTFLLMVIVFYAVPLMFALKKGFVVQEKDKKKFIKPSVWLVVLVAVPVVVIGVGNLISSTFFNATKYASVITVTEAEFSEDMPEADSVTNISLMDTASAAIIGNRALGELSDVVSQYQLSTEYTQINYKGTPQKVSNLEYADFFKWMNNRENGVPGYVMVDPVQNTAEYKKLSTSLRYVESGYFGDDLMRKLRFSYPTKIFDTVNFEIDEEGNPAYIVSCMKPRVGLFGAMDVNEVIIFNPCDGTSQIYAVKDAPTWIDNVYSGYLATEKYDWYGTMSGGFWNSVIGNKGCKQTTDDFGYIVIGDDVWYFTGVTSVSNDESNIGFIITNARTGEYRYYPVVGAEEYSAMGAAEGEVQEKGYVASFPSLINVSGEATYIMVLKDENGLVKLYALVNVENYGLVATGNTQTEAKEAYVKLLKQAGKIENSKPDEPDVETLTATVTVAKVRLATVDGNTVVYVTADDGVVYKGVLASDETLILVDEGMVIDVTYTETDHPQICEVVSWQAAKVE